MKSPEVYLQLSFQYNRFFNWLLKVKLHCGTLEFSTRSRRHFGNVLSFMGMQILWKFYKICLWEPEEIRSKALEYLKSPAVCLCFGKSTSKR